MTDTEFYPGCWARHPLGDRPGPAFSWRKPKLPPRRFVPPEVDVAAIRRKLRLTQREFGERYGFSAWAVRGWEQRRRRPDAAARTLLVIIDKEFDAVERALGGEG